jgi:hypothetical protein
MIQTPAFMNLFLILRVALLNKGDKSYTFRGNFKQGR